jgi:Tfp pilus assembly protein PilF
MDFHILRPALRSRLVWVATLALLFTLLAWWAYGRSAPTSPLVATPVILLERLQSKSLYLNDIALGWVQKFRPELLSNVRPTNDTKRNQQFAQASKIPKLFRQLDRLEHFDTLLLVGDPTQYQPLLDHLISTADWSLSYLDHSGMTFQRGTQDPWNLDNLSPLRTRLAPLPKQDRALFLARAATNFAAVKNFPAARKLLDEAAATDPHLPEVWNSFATYSLHKGEYLQALKEVDQALQINRKHLPSITTKVQLLHETKKFAQAYDLSKELIKQLPEDPHALFLHAKVAHESHAYQAETLALEKLILLAKNAGQPVSGYQLYLAQSYAARSQAKLAIQAFENFLEDPDAPTDQRAFAVENIARIKQRAGL